MTGPWLDNPERLLRESAWLAGLARCLARDPAAADDVYQETVLTALRRGATARGGLRPWLAGVARRVVAARRRTEGRRAAREATAAVAEAQPSAAEVVERAAMHRAVVDAVMELPEPYRAAILMRFFDDLPPAEVARRTGVPVETVRTRVKRGLHMLRSKLDERYGARATWLVPVAGLTRAEPQVAASAAVIGSASVLTTFLLLMNSKLTIAVAAAAVAASAWALWPAGPIETPRASSPDVIDSPAAVRTGGTAPAPAAGDEAMRRTVAASGTAGAAPGAVLLGRFVDAATGQPVAGVVVAASVPPTRRVFVEGKRTERPEPQPTRQPDDVRTDGDGRFAMPVPLGGKHRYDVRASAAGYVSVELLRVELEPGARVDLGEGRLVRGGRVLGAVVDTDERPVAGAEVILRFGDGLTPREHRGWVVVDSPEMRTGDDGRFASAAPVPFGPYRPDVRYPHRLAQEIRRPERVEADGAFIKLIVQKDRGWIRGTVVDAGGQPVDGAEIETRPTATFERVRTGSDGAFAVPRLRDCGDAVRIVVKKSGFPLLVSAGEHPFDGPPVRLVLELGAAQEFTVVGADGLAPVPRFGVDPLVRLWKESLEHRDDPDLVRVVDRPQGRATTRALAPGRYLMVVSRGPHGARRSLHDVELGERDGAHVLRLPPARELSVRVVRAGADGRRELQPVTGSVVQLIQIADAAPYREGLHVFEPSRLRTFGAVPAPKTAIVLESRKTAADGRASLELPDAQGLHLLVVGAGHAPVRVDGARLRDSGEELVITVEAGATLRGHLEPRSVERRLRPGLRLVAVDDPKRVFPDADSWTPSGQKQSPVDDKGNYELRGIPPGDWNVMLLGINWLDSRRGRGFQEHVATVRGLRAGEVRTVVLDCRRLVPCTLSGTAVFGDAPAAFARIRLTSGEGRDQVVITLDADEHGRFRGEVNAGRYTVTAQVRRDAEQALDVVRQGELELSAGQSVSQRLEFVRK